MTSRSGFVVAVLCVASLCDVPWVRTAEQLPVPALFLGRDMLAPLLPQSAEPGPATAVADEHEAGPNAARLNDAGWNDARLDDAPMADARLADARLADARLADAEAAALAWDAWLDAVALRPPPTDPDRETCVVSVIDHDARRRELVLRVPDIELERDSPVTHRGVLVGFVRPWSSRDERIVVDGRVRVALLGHPRARPVAATWEDQSLRFLVASREDAPTVTLRSRRIRPQPGQLAVSRNAAALGDTLPAGLALGRVAPVETDLPGGALALHTRDEPSLDVLLAPASLALVAIEAPLATELNRPAREARLLPSALLPNGRTDRRRHLDQGLLHGVRPGDPVVQGRRWVGRVEWAGPLTSIVSRELPATSLLVGDSSRQLVPVGLTPGAWPVDWQPQPGLPVFCGLPGWGGLAVGRLGPLDHDRLTVELGGFDPGRPVTVLSR